MSNKDTSLEGYVCPFCGPNAQATFEENCAECAANLGRDDSWFMRQIKDLEADLATKTRALAESQAEGERLRANWQYEQKHHQDSLKILDRVQREHGELHGQLAETKAEYDSLALDHEKTSSALRQASRWVGECEKLRARLAQQKKLTAGQQKAAGQIGREFDLLQKDWLKSIEERDTVRAQLAERDREIASMKECLSACEPAIETLREMQTLLKDPEGLDYLCSKHQNPSKALIKALEKILLPPKRTP